jgi:hypothetical protein
MTPTRTSRAWCGCRARPAWPGWPCRRCGRSARRRRSHRPCHPARPGGPHQHGAALAALLGPGSLHGSQRPSRIRYSPPSGLAGGDVLLVGQESTATSCADGGRFHTFDARGLRAGRPLRLLDSVVPAENTAAITRGLGSGCSAHWFSQQGQLVAASWFGAGAAHPRPQRPATGPPGRALRADRPPHLVRLLDPRHAHRLRARPAPRDRRPAGRRAAGAGPPWASCCTGRRASRWRS